MARKIEDYLKKSNLDRPLYTRVDQITERRFLKEVERQEGNQTVATVLRALVERFIDEQADKRKRN